MGNLPRNLRHQLTAAFHFPLKPPPSPSATPDTSNACRPWPFPWPTRSYADTTWPLLTIFPRKLTVYLPDTTIANQHGTVTASGMGAFTSTPTTTCVGKGCAPSNYESHVFRYQTPGKGPLAEVQGDSIHDLGEASPQLHVKDRGGNQHADNTTTTVAERHRLACEPSTSSGCTTADWNSSVKEFVSLTPECLILSSAGDTILKPVRRSLVKRRKTYTIVCTELEPHATATQIDPVGQQAVAVEAPPISRESSELERLPSNLLPPSRPPDESSLASHVLFPRTPATTTTITSVSKPIQPNNSTVTQCTDRFSPSYLMPRHPPPSCFVVLPPKYEERISAGLADGQEVPPGAQVVKTAKHSSTVGLQKVAFVCKEDGVTFETVAAGVVRDMVDLGKGHGIGRPTKITAKKHSARKASERETVEDVPAKVQTGQYGEAYDGQIPVNLSLSSQAGCAFKCAFCATGQRGLRRQLSVDEITDQILYFEQRGYKVNSLSFAGMGEPLSNPRLFDALSIITAPEYFNMSQRRISLSTIGVLPGIHKLNQLFPQVNLGFSLHSPFAEERNMLVPINRMFGLTEVFEVLDERLELTGRQVFLYYALIAGKNDSVNHAKGLADLIRNSNKKTRHLYHVNLQPLNAARGVSAEEFRQSGTPAVTAFEKILRQNLISFSHGNSFGNLIEAAPGQLYGS